MPIKLEPTSPNAKNGEITDEEVDEEQCTICLQPIVDCTVVPTCSHEFCFECLTVWSGQSRRCPLCSQNIGDYLIHRIRSTYDYQKHFLPPLHAAERAWGPRDRAAQDEADALERAVSRRRWIYQHNLYAKHVASNKYTRYRPYPTPAQFTASQDLISRMTFLVTFVISLMKAIDIRSESAIKLLAEFLDMDKSYIPGERYVNAEHFAHEIYCYLRSPYRDLSVYDSVVQYDTPPGIHPPPVVRADRAPIRIIRRGAKGDTMRKSQATCSPRAMTMPGDQPVPYNAAAAEDPSVQRGIRSRYGVVHALRHVSTPRENDGPHLRSPSPPYRNDETISPPSHREQTRFSEILDTPTNLSRSRSFDSDIPYSDPTTSDTLSQGARPKGASPPILLSPENNLDDNPVTSPQPHDGSAATTHTIDSVPLPSESRQPSNLSVTEPNITPESYDPPTINDHPVRTNPARRHRYRNQRDSIIAYLRSSSTSIPRFPTSVQPASLPSPLSDVMVAGIGGLEAVASTTEGQGGDEGGYARPESQRPERRPGPAVNDDSSVRKKIGATRAQSSGACVPPSVICLATAGAKTSAPSLDPSEAPACASRARLFDRLSAENNFATEARLRAQARLRARLAVERRLAKGERRYGARRKWGFCAQIVPLSLWV
ncbi:hypothetical protein H4582DRAFT_2080032 [Lactarius indigo]|nr:hypothetical protein H4582DRAFT_2080032 [Lactarius indigo]